MNNLSPIIRCNTLVRQFTSLSKGLFLSIISFFFLIQVSTAQAPDNFSYQGVVRDLSNNLITNTTLGVRITIRQGSASGSNLFRETHTPVTNGAGLFSIEVGTGINVNGSISGINWESGPFFIEQEIDPAGGTNYTISGTTQMLSVPYALYAKNSGRASSAATADQAASLSASGASGLSVPIGTILPFAGSNVPNGWLLCDGESYDNDAYSALEAVIGTTYGSPGSGRFRVPDLQGRVPVGRTVNNPSDSDFGNLNDSGGERTHVLTIPEMPAHNHTASTTTNGAHRHKIKGDNGGGGAFGVQANMLSEDTIDGCVNCIANFEFDTNFDGGHSHGISVGNRGGNQPHNNLQPYLTINYIIKAR